MKKRKGFTLVEMLVVLLIIGIMLGIGFLLNWNSIDQLRTKSSVEELSSFFDTKFLQIQASNYENGVVYSGIDITLSGGSTSIDYVYHLSGGDVGGKFYGETFTIMEISGDNQHLDMVTIQYVPFNPGCKFIGGDGTEINKLYFSAKPRGLKNACFEMDKNYCKLRAVRCPGDTY